MKEINSKSYIIIFLFILITGCLYDIHKPLKDNQSVIDLSRSYPKKEIRLQDIAEIEYIPIETTDEVLLSQVSIISHISDNYICVFDFAGNIFIFNRIGEIISYFNHTGQGDKEYNRVTGAGVVFDEKNDELFVFDSQSRILVYSLTGEYKRSLKYSSDLVFYSRAYNYDEETILVYDDYNYYHSNISNGSDTPYMLLSKKDGSVVFTLDIRLPIKYKKQKYIYIDGYTTTISITTPNSRNFDFNNFIIADISSDTIYFFSQNRELTPLLVRTPSVHASEPRIVWSNILTTEKFIVFQKTTLDLSAAEKGQQIPSKILMYEFNTRETSEVSFVDINYDKMKWRPAGSLGPQSPKNIDAAWLWAHSLKEAYQEKRLNGELEKLAASIDEEDNPILMIVKFK